jgi:sporulation protein YlmC with PRC-barrel domain
MKSLKNMTGDSLEQMIDYKVVDQNGENIGTLHSLWSDPTTGGVEFLGVKTGWLFGHNHVVPAEKAELDEANGVVRLPYTALFIKEAPSIPADSEISEMEEDNIYQFYGLTSPAHAAAEAAAANSAGSEGTPALATEADAGTAARWRRTSRPGDPVSPAAIANLESLGDANPAAGTALGSVLPPSYGTAPAPATPPPAGHTNPDPITGEPGAHPVGTGLGAAAAGAAGFTIGAAVGGPVGAPIGAAVGGLAGAITGGLAGKGIAEAVNPTTEDAYWSSAYRNTPYFEDGYEYADYAPAYRVGYEGFGLYGVTGGEFGDVEPALQQEYSKIRGGSKLGWDKAGPASRDAWQRLKDKFAPVK